MRTKYEISYRPFPNLKTFTIPEGTPVTLATNLPQTDGGKYWAQPWAGMTNEEKSWERNYGFLIRQEEVREDTLEEWMKTKVEIITC